MLCCSRLALAGNAGIARSVEAAPSHLPLGRLPHLPSCRGGFQSLTGVGLARTAGGTGDPIGEKQ